MSNCFRPRKPARKPRATSRDIAAALCLIGRKPPAPSETIRRRRQAVGIQPQPVTVPGSQAEARHQPVNLRPQKIVPDDDKRQCLDRAKRQCRAASGVLVIRIPDTLDLIFLISEFDPHFRYV